MLRDQEARVSEEKSLQYRNKEVDKWISWVRNGEQSIKKVKQIDSLGQLDQDICFRVKHRKVLEIEDDFDIVFIIYFQIYTISHTGCWNENTWAISQQQSKSCIHLKRWRRCNNQLCNPYSPNDSAKNSRSPRLRERLTFLNNLPNSVCCLAIDTMFLVNCAARCDKPVLNR